MMETANISSELTESGEGRAYPWREDVRVPDPSTWYGGYTGGRRRRISYFKIGSCGRITLYAIAHFTRRPAWYSAADRRTFTNEIARRTPCSKVVVWPHSRRLPQRARLGQRTRRWLGQWAQ